MKSRFRSTRGKVAAAVGLVAIAASVTVGFSAIAGEGSTKSEHWGVIDRNTIGSAVGGPAGRPVWLGRPHRARLRSRPLGKGSVGIQVSDNALNAAQNGGVEEKAAFGNEVDFFGDLVQGLNQVGFHVFQTGENAGPGGPGNLPNITFEVDPSGPGSGTAPNYSSLVFVPNGTGVSAGSVERLYRCH